MQDEPSEVAEPVFPDAGLRVVSIDCHQHRGIGIVDDGLWVSAHACNSSIYTEDPCIQESSFPFLESWPSMAIKQAFRDDKRLSE